MPGLVVRIPQQRLHRVLRRNSHTGPAIFFELCLGFSAADQSHIAKIPTRILIDRLDLHGVIGSYDVVPVEPHFPPIGHRVGGRDIDYTGSLPVTTPPGRRVECPKVL